MDVYAPVGNKTGRGSVQLHTNNCFTLAWMGEIIEGITLEFDHPLARMKTALVMGEHFIAVNAYRGRAPDLKEVGARSLMAAADLDEILPPGKKPFKVFGQLLRPAPFVLLHLDYGVPQNIVPKHTFWAGFDTRAEVVAYGGSEALFKLDHEYGDIRVFYADGRVGDVHYAQFGMKSSIDFIRDEHDVLVARLNLVEQKLHRYKMRNPEESSTRVQDKWFHELANMLMLAPDAQMRRLISNTAERLSALYPPSGGVRYRFGQIFADLGDRTIYGWLFNNHASVPSTERPVKPATTNGDRKAEEAKRQANRAARLAAQPKKGPKMQDDSKASKRKK